MMNRITFGFSDNNGMSLIVTTHSGNELWLGNYYAATNHSLLRQKKIKAVLTAAAMLNISYPKQLDINHKIINAYDVPSYKMTPHFEEAFQFINRNIKNGHILVHCAAGISRSTTCVLIYLMKEHKMPFRDAMQLVKCKRPIANPNYGFQGELLKYDLVLRQKGHYRVENLQKQKENKKQQSNYGQKEQKIQLSSRNDDKNNFRAKSHDIQRKKKQIFAINTSKKPQSFKDFSQNVVEGNKLKQIKGKSQAYRSSMHKYKNIDYNRLLAQNKIQNGENLGPINHFFTLKLQIPRLVPIKR